ncbi:hypothetical protein EVAR_5624_1 [Eumeta japonica]|uniref:Uncharacterized protein n=1 Tax=Eumeta variegata TaxID=151549 RepID=A0A4C1T7A9_EUMVA|nr:hypothetical protein EVAR_5624_1 [Eumeta japonica]
MSSLLLFGLGSGLSGRRWRLRLPVRILSVQISMILLRRHTKPQFFYIELKGSNLQNSTLALAGRDPLTTIIPDTLT